MNKIDAIIVHCSATKAGLDIGKKEITQMHLQRGFSTIGYNYVIRLDGTVEVGRSLTIDGAHCNSKGFSGVSYNKHSIGICYIGGLDEHG
ncbi:MAG: N-acetylmuramoyl-L-alanine amidase, partial [Phocaeicola plebeius]|nr:N-acetylmuramoyl-L-alanine amidase [Phocaeicola plebeius]